MLYFEYASARAILSNSLTEDPAIINTIDKRPNFIFSHTFKFVEQDVFQLEACSRYHGDGEEKVGRRQRSKIAVITNNMISSLLCSVMIS